MFKTAISNAANQEKVSSEKKDSKKQRENNKGFTLIELMIAIAIVAILSSVAFPSYFEYIRKARASDAKSALMGLGNALERYKAKNSTYSVGLATIYSQHSPVEVEDCASSGCYYGLAFAVKGNGWNAIAIPTDSSTKDSGTLCLKSTGARCINKQSPISSYTISSNKLSPAVSADEVNDTFCGSNCTEIW